jgi:Calcium-activated chloride channel
MNCIIGCGLKMRKLELEKKVLAYFPMPNLALKTELQETWFKLCGGPNSQPFVKIRSYFGEKIALFFEFRGHLTTWLLFPAVVGLAFQCVVIATADFSNGVIPFFSLFIAVWSVLMTEFWKRREISVAMESGMTDLELDMHDRPEFKVRNLSTNFTSSHRNIPISYHTARHTSNFLFSCFSS